MKNSRLFAGLDISTQGCKIVVIDADAGAVIHVDSIQYDSDLPHYGTRNGVIQSASEGVSESDPRMWIEAVERLFEGLKRSGLTADRILGIGVSGQQHGLVSLDAAGELTRPRAKLWNDFSTLEECRILTELIGGPAAMIAEVGNTQRTGYTAAKIFHMFRHERNGYDRTSVFFLVHNFINWFLTGGRDGGVRVMEPGDASGTALWNPATGTWSKKVIDAIDPELLFKLPPIRPSTEFIGFVSKALCVKYGFPGGCIIDAGSGDNMCGAIGTGNIKPGIVTVSLGTSGTAYTVLETPFIDPAGEIAAFCDSTGHFLPLLCVSNLANGYNEVLRRYELTHESFSEIVKKTRPGNGGRLLVPWFSGERTPDLPLATPIYFGFNPADFTPEILCRAVLEGHVLNLYDGFRKMPVSPAEIRLTGGLSKSEAWCRAIAGIFETETVPVEGEGAALGAAVHAAWIWGEKEGHPELTDLAALTDAFVILDEKRRQKPDPRYASVLRLQKSLYRALSARLRGESGEDPFELRSRMMRLAPEF